MDTLVSSERLLDRLGREEQQLRKLGLHGHAEGVRNAITILLRHVDAAREQPEPPAPLDPSS
jgi:hypothetical protein